MTTPPRSFVTPALLAVAFVAALTLGPGGAQAQEAPHGSRACAQALADEKAAAAPGIPPQRSYDDTVAGLAANARCTDPVARIVNAGYLLSMRAMAERNLRMGDWRRDFQMADEYLGKCIAYGKRIGSHARDCRVQQIDNRRFQRLYAEAAAAETPVPAPTPVVTPTPLPPPPLGAITPAPRPSPHVR